MTDAARSYPWHAQVRKGKGPTASFPILNETFDEPFFAMISADGCVAFCCGLFVPICRSLIISQLHT